MGIIICCVVVLCADVIPEMEPEQCHSGSHGSKFVSFHILYCQRYHINANWVFTNDSVNAL